MIYRYFIILSFKGTNYHGWQIQPNANSVQGVLGKVLSVKLKENIELTGAGRTDTGVHARLFTAHFDSTQAFVDIGRFIREMNSFLPSDITVKDILPVRPEAHSRFSAISRTYQYHINIVKNSFSKDFSYFYHGDLDIEKMNEASDILKNYHDFTSFCKSKSNSKSKLCKIYSADWKINEDFIIFTICADRFLRNMVRAIVGTLIEVGNGRMTLEKFKKIIEEKNRNAAGLSVPACGLFLTDIMYPDNIFE